MTQANVAKVTFQGGEIMPELNSRDDLDIYNSSVARAYNFSILQQGPATYRQGFRYVSHTRRNRIAVFIPFQFNDTQSYLIEATDLRFRFYTGTDLLREATKTITGITKANPGVVTCASHGYSNGDEVQILGVGGMTEVNGRSFVIAGVTTNTFQLRDENDVPVDTTSFTTYTSGGTVSRVYELVTPYTEAHLAELQYAQDADTMYITHQEYDIRKLSRSGPLSWTLATFTRSHDPFTGAGKWPRAVCFSPEGRLWYGGTKDAPETFWASRSPSSSGTRFDDFGINPSVVESDAFTFTLAPVQGQVDAIQWISATDRFMVIGTFGTVRRVYGATEASPVTALAINSKPVNSFGASLALPSANGPSVFYIERGNRRVRSFQYNFQTDGYVTADKNLVAGHLFRQGIKQVVNQTASSNVLWVVSNDGKLYGLTYNDAEGINAWHQTALGGVGPSVYTNQEGAAKILYAGVMPRANNSEQLWVITERFINGVTRRYVEYLMDSPVYPTKEQFFSGDSSENETPDYERYAAAMYEVQKFDCHLDASGQYNGFEFGTVALTSAVQEVGAIGFLDAASSYFTASMVGRQIWVKYDEQTGLGGGRVEITAFTSGTRVTVKVLSRLWTLNIPASTWALTTDTVSGLRYLEGQTVSVVADGAVKADAVVTDGRITLDAQASVVQVGYKYLGMIKSNNLTMVSNTGRAYTKLRGVNAVHLSFIHTAYCKIGTSLYRLYPVLFRDFRDYIGRPPTLFSGVTPMRIEDSFSPSFDEDRAKYIYLVVDKPLPCTVQSFDVFGDTSDE